MSVRRDNKWIYGPTALPLPPLPAPYRGAIGCQFEQATFDPRVGREVCLLILETTEYAHRYANTRPFELVSTQGLVRTANGIVAYIVWTIAAKSLSETKTEQFLDPHNRETIELMSAVAQQSHLKAFIVDSTSNRLCDWFEFENNFGFDRFRTLMAQSTEREREGDFQAAMEEVMASHSTEELLGG